MTFPCFQPGWQGHHQLILFGLSPKKKRFVVSPKIPAPDLESLDRAPPPIPRQRTFAYLTQVWPSQFFSLLQTKILQGGQLTPRAVPRLRGGPSWREEADFDTFYLAFRCLLLVVADSTKYIMSLILGSTHQQTVWRPILPKLHISTGPQPDPSQMMTETVFNKHITWFWSNDNFQGRNALLRLALSRFLIESLTLASSPHLIVLTQLT